jgi:hypothetical protein
MIVAAGNGPIHHRQPHIGTVAEQLNELAHVSERSAAARAASS